MVKAISLAFQVVLLVIIFSGIRGLYQGIIITQLATNWLTIGVVATSYCDVYNGLFNG